MKLIKASELQVGDLFLFQDMLSTINSNCKYIATERFPYIIVKLIVGPTKLPTYVSADRRYYLDLKKEVTLLVRDGSPL